MQPDDVRSLYGGQYAKRLNLIWHESNIWRPEAGHHLRMLDDPQGWATESGVRRVNAGMR